MASWKQVSTHLYLWQDTCNAYVVVSDGSAIAVDFGSGDMLEALAEIGVEKLDYILHTHHHRDQCQGDRSAIQTGTRVLVPEAERDLFVETDRLWQRRQVLNNYDVRQDRFSLIEPIAIDGVLRDLDRWCWKDYEFRVLPSPGHTTGSISLCGEIDGRRVAFTGDLIYAGGKVWSLAATQWSYHTHQGILATLYSLSILEEERPEILLPSHGPAIDNPDSAMASLRANLRTLNGIREQRSDWEEKIRRPWQEVSPHLLYNTLSGAASWLVLGVGGKAMMIDCGYFFNDIQVTYGSDRAARRTLPPPMQQLREEYGVNHIEVAIPTHYHDDHVASMGVLKRLFNTQIWAPENFACILAAPRRYDLPCLWFDPVPIDVVLPMNASMHWNNYEFGIYPLPGHTHYAAAICFEVDGKKALAIGDQHYNNPYLWNYVYQNRVAIGDYKAAVSLYRRLKPDLILSGHMPPFDVSAELLDKWDTCADEFDRVHRELLPLNEFDWGPCTFGCFLEPYQLDATPGKWTSLTAHIKNPLREAADVLIEAIVPPQWQCRPERLSITLESGMWGCVEFKIKPEACRDRCRRTPIAIDVSVGGRRLGQIAECLVDVTV